jgi:predicted outer membrane repeat protein
MQKTRKKRVTEFNLDCRYIYEMLQILKSFLGKCKMKKILLILLVTVISFTNSKAEWEKCNGPFSGNVEAILVDNNYAYVGDGGAFYASSDYGETWYVEGRGVNIYTTKIFAFASFANNLFAATNRGISISTNYGIDWDMNGMYLGDKSIQDVKIIDNLIYVGTNNGIYISKTNFKVWSQLGLIDKFVNCIYYNTNIIFVGTDNGLFKSSDKGLNWNNIDVGKNSNVLSVIQLDSNLLIATQNGVKYSEDFGKSWILSKELSNFKIWNLASDGKNIYAGTEKGIYISTDKGQSWSNQSYDIPNLDVRCINVQNSKIYVGTMGDGVFKKGINEVK